MKALQLEEIVSAVGGTILGTTKEKIVIEAITTDTRKITEGNLFIPIKGEKFDGHDFIQQAFEKGAKCCFSQISMIPPEGKLLILVQDTRKALRDLAEYYMSLFAVNVVAVTGSVGKTTTKDMIASVLSQKYSVLKTEGNFNNEIGLPLTVFQLDESYHTVVLEMGMNSFGEIHNLSKIAKPDIVVITNIGVSHIENLGSREGILKAKCEIFDFMKENGIAVLNADDDKLLTLSEKQNMRISWFGLSNTKGITADEIIPNGLEGVSCTIHTKKGDFKTTISVPGEHMVLNALSATAVGLSLGLELEQIKTGIEQFVPTQMRMAVLKTKQGTTIINDSYNANPASTKAAIDVLKNTAGRKVCILGDMFELGDYGEQMHKEVGLYAAQSDIDLLICIGKLSGMTAFSAMEAGCENVLYYNTIEVFFEHGLHTVEIGDTVLVKASRGMHFEKIVEKIQEVK